MGVDFARLDDLDLSGAAYISVRNLRRGSVGHSLRENSTTLLERQGKSLERK
jgi:hypothetical protein